jgi:hypothetical protein
MFTEMRAVCLTNFKMKKWINVYKKSVGWDKVQITPAEMSGINNDADEIFGALDLNKVRSQFCCLLLAI